MPQTPPTPELTLAQLLADPVIRTIMRRDGVAPEDVAAMMTRTARNLRPLPYAQAAE